MNFDIKDNSNAAPAIEVEGLEVVASLHQHFDGRRRVQVPNGVYDQDAGWGAKVEPLCRLSDATAVIDQLRAENAELVEALRLAANRLDRLTLEVSGGYWRSCAAEWTGEARAALAKKELSE